MNRADEDDFRSFVAARSPSLLWFAHLLTGDRYAAEDIVQTALAKTAAGWSRVRRKDNPEGYVRRAIVNTHLNAVRRRPWREQPREHIPEDVDSRSREHELDDRDSMWHALAGLPPRQRAVLVLRYYDDLDSVEMCAILGCSRETLAVRIHRSLRALRHAIAKESADVA